MRPLIFILTLIWTIGLYAQNSNSQEVDNRPFLNKSEVTLLNSLLEKQRDTFDFKDKKVAFLTGSSGGVIVSKSEYFSKSLIPWIEKASNPQISMVRLTDEEKLKSGGFDVLVLSWVKLFTDKRQKRTIEILGKIE